MTARRLAGAALWSLFAVLVIGGGWLFLRACALDALGLDYCPLRADGGALRRAAAEGDALAREVHMAELSAAEAPVCAPPAPLRPRRSAAPPRPRRPCLRPLRAAARTAPYRDGAHRPQGGGAGRPERQAAVHAGMGDARRPRPQRLLSGRAHRCHAGACRAGHLRRRPQGHRRQPQPCRERLDRRPSRMSSGRTTSRPAPTGSRSSSTRPSRMTATPSRSRCACAGTARNGSATMS